jgi:chromosome segregation ATPase
MLQNHNDSSCSKPRKRRNNNNNNNNKVKKTISTTQRATQSTSRGGSGHDVRHSRPNGDLIHRRTENQDHHHHHHHHHRQQQVEDHPPTQAKLERIDRITHAISSKTHQLDNMNSKIRELTDLNNNLANGYELSLRLVLDVSKLLQNYTRMFDSIEGNLRQVDRQLDGIKSSDIGYISSLTKESISKISQRFHEQYPSIIHSLEKQGSETSARNAAKLKHLIKSLPLAY